MSQEIVYLKSIKLLQQHLVQRMSILVVNFIRILLPKSIFSLIRTVLLPPLRFLLRLVLPLSLLPLHLEVLTLTLLPLHLEVIMSGKCGKIMLSIAKALHLLFLYIMNIMIIVLRLALLGRVLALTGIATRIILAARKPSAKLQKFLKVKALLQ
jgi:hypothetical protein